MKEFLPAYLLIIPVMLFYILICYVPMFGIVIAFKEYNIMSLQDSILAAPWAGGNGFGNFTNFLQDTEFMNSLRNTLIISALKIVICFPMPVVLALLLNELSGHFFKRSIQTVLYLPRFISWVIVGGFVFSMLSANSGMLNSLLQKCFGLEENINFMYEEKYFVGIVIVTEIWKSAGWSSIIYVAALAAVNQELYEAAKIDGANKFEQVLHISLPGIKATVILMFTLALSGILNAGFDQIFVLYNPTVYSVGDIIDTFVYRRGLANGYYDFATAVGLVKSVIGVGIIIAVDKFLKKIGERGVI